MSDFLTQLALRARRAEAARAAKLSQLGDDIARTGRAQRGLYSRALTADGGPYPQYLSQFDELAERMADLERRRGSLANDTPYLERIRRAYKSPGEPDMSLDSGLFRDMYQADQAFEQLRSGRAANLRNAGGELASIAGQAIRDADDAARAARSMSPLESALQVGPDGMVALGVLGGGLAAGAGGMVVNNALQERRRRQAEAAAAAQAALGTEELQYINDMDRFDPINADIMMDEYDEHLLSELTDRSEPAEAMLRQMERESMEAANGTPPPSDMGWLAEISDPSVEYDFHSVEPKTRQTRAPMPSNESYGPAMQRMPGARPPQPQRRKVLPQSNPTTGVWY